MSIADKAKELGISTAVRFLEKDPEKNLGKLMDWVDRFAGNTFSSQRYYFRRAMVEDKDSNWRDLTLRVVRSIDRGCLTTLFKNFFMNASLVGGKRQEAARAEYGCNVPWAILLDPTSACNLHCTGCWAAEYGHKMNLTFEEIDSIIEQGKELGVFFYIYTGGEPLVRKKDLIRLCEKHSECIFLSFTNGTLIDEDFANDMLRVKNFIPAISLEGFEEATDARRGEGVYKRATDAMRLLKEKRLPFGISACYTSQNMESITSEEFYDSLIEAGAFFIWYFHYMPVGKDAVKELLPTPQQREYIYHKIREYRTRKAIFGMDFQNDGEFVGGCIAGGRRYLHINANGDMEPCVFIHYSDSNIREKTLLEGLRSPLFMAYHDGQPFNNNHLRPCPMLENPEKLRAMVKDTKAASTDLEAPEEVDTLCDRCSGYAENWKGKAQELWDESHPA
jgi:MoaA/NifB/PqqE/SkfB family radical SAM enzyme